MRKTAIALILLIGIPVSVSAQFPFGTTGLLHMPTAEMQRDKTFMAGASFLSKAATPAHWSYDTYNYYINITFFPWLEIGYTCTLHRMTVPAANIYRKFTNQDRQFSGRLRILKEGWGWRYMPSLVLGVNDATTRDWQGTNEKEDGSGFGSPTTMGNGHWNRYYLAMTKHLVWKQIGDAGFHLAYVYNRRKDYHLNGICIGADFRPYFHKKLQIIIEYDSRTVNLGWGYSIWKDHINLVAELNQCKYFSAGIYFKVHLK